MSKWYDIQNSVTITCVDCVPVREGLTCIYARHWQDNSLHHQSQHFSNSSLFTHCASSDKTKLMLSIHVCRPLFLNVKILTPQHLSLEHSLCHYHRLAGQGLGNNFRLTRLSAPKQHNFSWSHRQKMGLQECPHGSQEGKLGQPSQPAG